MIERFERISDEQARALWQRAAQLQAAAERNPQRALPGESAGLSLEQVAAAAEGAGISSDYVRVALAERMLPDAEAIDPNHWKARWVRALLREPDAIEQSRIIDAPASTVLSALRTVAARPSFDLMPESTVGDDPLSGAVLIYRLANHKTSFQEELNWADVRVLLFTLRADGEQTILRVRVPLFRRGINLLLTSGSASTLGALGLKLGAVLSGSLPAALTATATLAMLPVAIAGVAGAALGVGVYRGFYRSCYAGGSSSINQLLQAVAMEAEMAGHEALKTT